MLTMRNALPATVALLLIILTACQGTPTQRSTGEYIDDEAVASKVKAALIENQATEAMQIDVETFRGTVQLNGFVDSTATKTEAARLARSVEGVREVHNNLEVRSEQVSAGQYINDAALTARVKSALFADKETKAYQINVETSDAVVQLAGWVDTLEAKSEATRIASSVDGVKEVRNELEVRH